MVQAILLAAHHPVAGAHFRKNKMAAQIRTRYYWVGYLENIAIFLENCEDCKRRGNPRQKKAPMQIYITGAPFLRCSVDLLGPYQISKAQNRYLVVLVDTFTKWPEVIPVRDASVRTVAHALLFNVFVRFGMPQILVTDNAPIFLSQLWRGVMEILGINNVNITPLHPSANPVERLNRTVVEHLRLMIDENQDNWDEMAMLFLLGYRTLPHATTGIAPSMLLFGRYLSIPAELQYGTPFQEAIKKNYWTVRFGIKREAMETA